jgi:DSF synthase
MGAVSLLERRIGLRAAEQLILSGKMLPAYKLHEMGVVDVLAKNGQGETAVRDFIATNAKRRNGMQALFRSRQFVRPVTREELDGIVNLWVDAALRLSERELKMMGRLARAQARRMEHEYAARQGAVAPVEEALAMAG